MSIDFQSHCVKLEKTAARLREERGRLERELTRLGQRTESVEKKLRDTSKLLESKKSENQRLRSERDEYREKYHEYKSNFEQSRDLSQKYADQNEAVRRQNEQLKKSHSKSKSIIKDLKAELTTVRESIHKKASIDVQQEIRGYVNQIQLLSIKIEEFNVEKINLTEENASLKKKLDEVSLNALHVEEKLTANEKTYERQIRASEIFTQKLELQIEGMLNGDEDGLYREGDNAEGTTPTGKERHAVWGGVTAMD